MKICFVSSMHPSNDKRVHDKEARSLAAAGFEVVHICPDANTQDEGSSCTLDGVTVRQYRSGSGLRARVRQLGKLYRLAKAENADVYHCNEVDSWAVGVALKIFRRKKCVFDVHEHYPSTFAQSRFPSILQPTAAGTVRLAFRLLLPFTDRIVLAKRTVSRDFRCSDSKKVLVQNFTPTTGLALSRDRSPRSSSSTMTVVHLGLFSRVRGWPEVLEAMRLANDNIRLQVIGTINDGSESEFHARVQELGLSGRVEILNWMPFSDAFKYLEKAQVGIISFQPYIQNHVFAMPHKLFDYMAAGMAAIVPKQAVEIAPIVVETDCGFLVDPSDPKQIASALDALFNDPSGAHEMGRRGKEAVLVKYNWEAEAKKLVKMYQDL